MTDADWVPLSVREGRREAAALSEAFTPAATNSLLHWLEGELGYRSVTRRDDLVLYVATACDVTLNRMDTYSKPLVHQLLEPAGNDDGMMLDVVDATLKLGQRDNPTALRTILKVARSVWTVREDDRGLVRLVDRAASEAFAAAIRTQDEASNELIEAWSRAYGKEEDASDAWDHAIKAVEAALIPVLVPNKDKPNLGSALGELRSNARHWTFGVDGDSEGVEKVLRLMWPNPDRHAGTERRTPTIEEARGVLHLAITVVQWTRIGLITKQ